MDDVSIVLSGRAYYESRDLTAAHMALKIRTFRCINVTSDTAIDTQRGDAHAEVREKWDVAWTASTDYIAFIDRRR
ncbi:glycoside hydrolase 15-like protein [Anopheles sinensis]|uniref:Glycoside hydrolase 15-like protein n=1 Tax=Anopheles sinensis TaxID=74873 RepID=A0A084VTQ1_ANOSI|nr:glycoside hydrolase 15-like protein [Anopheles sinensis]